MKCQDKSNLYSGKSLLEVAIFGINNPDQSDRTFDTLMSELQRVDECPVVYVIDEHNEIWKANKQDLLFFRVFQISTSSTKGVWRLMCHSLIIVSHQIFDTHPFSSSAEHLPFFLDQPIRNLREICNQDSTSGCAISNHYLRMPLEILSRRLVWFGLFNGSSFNPTSVTHSEQVTITVAVCLFIVDWYWSMLIGRPLL